MLTLLLENQWQPTLTLLIPPSNSWPWEKSFLRCLLACKRIWRTPNHIEITQTQPSHLLQGSGTNPIYHDALQAHMHPLHKLGLTNTIENYHEYYQTPIKNGTANGAASNAYLTAPYVHVKTKCINMKYRTGTLYNQKHAVWCKHSISLTSPLCS